MTKEEKIQEAYGEHWELFKNYVEKIKTGNGWALKSLIPFLNIEEIEFCEALNRPKSIQGIENNNGWIKIESESDLPKESAQIFVIYKDKIEVGFYNCHYKKWFCSGQYYSDTHQNIGITHYQPIEKPKPPIY